MLTKRQIRSKIFLRLKLQKEEIRNRKSRLIKKKLFGTKIFKKARALMLYIAFGGEVDTKEMIKESQKIGKIVAVPICVRDRIMKACILDPRAKLVRGPYGVWEPVIKKTVKLDNLDLVVVPGVAFDKKGNRLGRGRGCYDYFLKKLPPRTPAIGLAFNFQILPVVPATSDDVRVGRVIYA